MTGRRRTGRRSRARALTAVSAVLVGAAISACLAGDAPDARSAVQHGWREMSRLQFRRAHEALQTTGPMREARFARAMALLNVQPKTRTNIDAADDALRTLTAEDGDDEWGVAAQYFLARIEQVHRYEPDRTRALEMYARLKNEHPDHYYGQMAAVKWAILRIYDPDGDAASRAGVLDELEPLGEILTDDDAARSFHLVMADAYCRFELSNARPIEHLLAVDRLGIATRRSEADLYVRIGELARLEGRTDLAREYYRRLLEGFPRDARAYMVRQRLKELDDAAAPSTGVSE